MNKKPFPFRVTLGDKIFFARNLALLLKSGIALTEALSILRESVKSKSMKFILDSVIQDVEKGQYLSSALMKFSDQFDNFFVSVIKVGEISGKLIENAERIALELRKIQRLRSKIISAMIYPSFIIGVMVMIFFLVIYFLFPRLLPVFESLNVELPLTTKIFLKFASFFLNYGHFFILFIFFLFILFILGSRKPNVKIYFDKFFLHLPILGNVLKQYALASFCRNLALLLSSGLGIVESLELTSQSLGNLVYKQKIKEASEFVVKGHSLGEFLLKYPFYFPYNFVKMISIGERTGNLEQTFFYLADNFEEEIDIALERLVNSLEPLILVIIAGLVGFIAISIITPIYELSDKLTK